MATISFEEALGSQFPSAPALTSSGGNLISFEEATGIVEQPTLGKFLKNPQSWKDMAGYAAGVGAQLSDMFTGVGKSLLGGGAYLLERGSTVGTGPKELQIAAKRAQKVKDSFPEELATPWKVVADNLGPEAQRAYEENGVGWILGKIGEFVEQGGKAAEKSWGIPASDVVNAVDMFMGAVGAKAMKPQAQAMVKQRLGQLRSEMKTARTPETLPPEILAAMQERFPGKPVEKAPVAPEAQGPVEAKPAVPEQAVTPEVSVTPDPLNPYKVAAAAGTTGLAAWALQDELTDEQLAAAGFGAAIVGSKKLSGLPESRLVEMLKEGGEAREAAAARIYTDNVPKLSRGLQKYVRQGVEVEDVIQRTMEKGLRAIEKGQFSGDAAISTYLYRIAENEVKSGMRYEKVRPKTESLDLTEQAGRGRDDASLPSAHEQIADPNARSPEQLALDSALGQRMADALEKLPPEFRAPFELRELQGLDYAEIAQQLDQPIGTVRSQIARAKEKLQRSLYEYRQEAGVIPREQAGNITPDQLFTIAGATGGALLGSQLDEESLRGAVLGLLAGGMLGSSGGRAIIGKGADMADKALGATATRVGNIAPELRHALRTHAHRVAVATATTHEQVAPFLRELKKLPDSVQDEVARQLLNSDIKGLKAIPELAKTYPAVAKTLQAVEVQLKSLGRFAEGVADYFPRLVKDYEGLKNALGQRVASDLDKHIYAAEAAMLKKEGRGLTDVERSIAINRFLFPSQPGSGQPGFTHARNVREVTTKLQPFYEKPADSLLRYLSGAITDIEKARFFGRDLRVTKKDAQKFTNTDASIGELTSRLIEQKKITPVQAQELQGMLDAYFVGGEKAMNPALAAVRDLTNAGLLGQVAATATQLGDVLAPIRHYGWIPTLQGLIGKIKGEASVTPKELGLANHIMEELGGNKRLPGKLLENVLKFSGFSLLDNFGKGLSIRAALKEAQGQARTAKGRVRLAEEWGAAYGSDLPRLLDDLEAGRVTDLTRSFAFEKLSDIQPISRAEMPEMYLRHPNGRLLYQLKTYMLKQVDIVRRESYNEIRNGLKNNKPAQVVRGLKNLASLATLYALSNIPGDAIKDWLSGREVDLFSTPKLVENVVQTFGFNRYAADKVVQGKVIDTVRDMITPPVRVLEDIALGRDKAASYIPFIGRQIYDTQFYGNEKREIAENILKNRGIPRGYGTPLSEAAKEYAAKKRAETKLKKAEKDEQWHRDNPGATRNY